MVRHAEAITDLAFQPVPKLSVQCSVRFQYCLGSAMLGLILQNRSGLQHHLGLPRR